MDVFLHIQLARDVPPGSVEKQHGVDALRDIARDFVEVKLHHIGVDVGQCERAPTPRAGQCAVQIGVVIALVGRLARSLPRLAHCRTWPFFWPIRASSSNHISTGVVSGNPSR